MEQLQALMKRQTQLLSIIEREEKAQRQQEERKGQLIPERLLEEEDLTTVLRETTSGDAERCGYGALPWKDFSKNLEEYYEVVTIKRRYPKVTIANLSPETSAKPLNVTIADLYRPIEDIDERLPAPEGYNGFSVRPQPPAISYESENIETAYNHVYVPGYFQDTYEY